MADSAPASPQTPLEYALAYARMGWPVIPINWIRPGGACSCGDPHDGEQMSAGSVGKHPYKQYAPNGVYSATTDEARIRAWWTATPQLNIGVATGGGRGVVDVDTRNGGHVVWEELCRKNNYTPNTLTAKTGGGGWHYVYDVPEGFKLKYLGRGIDIKNDGGLIVVEPSTHASGRQYCWLDDGNPFEGWQIERAPDWMLEPKVMAPANVTTVAGGAIGYIPDEQMADLKDALRCISAESREMWRNVGSALHSTSDPRAFAVWDEWSRTCPEKYQEGAQRKLWAWLDNNRGASRFLHIESVFFWAQEAGWKSRPVEAVPIESVQLLRQKPTQVPISLLRPPGVLGKLTDWINATASRKRPVFAVGAALAIASVVCGRRYITNRKNLTALYWVMVGKSGAGKEHVRTAIYEVLTAAGWPELIGRSGFASDSAVISGLLAQPTQIAVMDELGDYLGNLQSDGAMHARSAVKGLVEAWGSLHSKLTPKQFSTLHATRDQVEAQSKHIVVKPSLTLVGLTTPRTFYGALNEQSIEGGFFSRLLVVECDLPRSMPDEPSHAPVPDEVVEWIKAVRAHAAGSGNLSGVPASADCEPNLTRVQITPAAQAVFDDYLMLTLANADELESEGLAELEVRSAEKAMRIALALAVARDPVAPQVLPEDAHWACEYVKFWTERTVKSIRQNMHGGKFAKAQADVLRIIAASAAKGRTEAELPRYSRTFNDLDPVKRRQVLEALCSRGSISLVEMKTGGRTRKAWVAIQEGATE